MRYSPEMLAAIREDLRLYTVDELFAVKGVCSRVGNQEALTLIQEEIANRCDEVANQLVAKLISGTQVNPPSHE